MNSLCNEARHRHHRPGAHYRHHHHENEKPLVLIGSVPSNGQTNVSPNINAIKLIFGRDFDNDLGWANAGNQIDMWQDSNKVPIRIRKGSDRCEGHRVILVKPINPLLGGTTYKVRVKSFFVDKNGEKIKRIKLIVFTTRCR